MDKNDFRWTIKNDLSVMRRNKIISALCYIVLGVVLLAWPGETMITVSCLVGVLLAVGGVAAIVMYFVNGTRGLFSYAGLAGGVIVGVIGVWLFFNPEFLVRLIPTIVGLMLAISGLVNVVEAIKIRREHDESIWIAFILAVITIALGVLIFVEQQHSAEFVIRMMGIALVYDGVSDLLMVGTITGIIRKKEFLHQLHEYGLLKEVELSDIKAAGVPDTEETGEKNPFKKVLAFFRGDDIDDDEEDDAYVTLHPVSDQKTAGTGAPAEEVSGNDAAEEAGETGDTSEANVQDSDHETSDVAAADSVTEEEAVPEVLTPDACEVASADVETEKDPAAETDPAVETAE